MKKVCVITGTRAEYGLLKPLIEKINRDNSLDLKLIATGMHLSPEFGLTYKVIEEDGYVVDEKIDILLSSDSPTGIAKSMGLALISFGEAFERMKPDCVIVLGDRFEIMSVALATTVFRIPLIHLHGGEITEGLIDDPIRHSITKQAHLHFTSTEKYRKRVIQLGEEPKRVFNVGAIGIENIVKMKLLSREELEESLNFKLEGRYALCTFHPVTLENNTSEKQFKELLEAFDELSDLKVIFTKANADTEGRVINRLIEEYVNANGCRAIAFASLGQLKYLTAMKYCDFVIGNSSSGIIETPTFGVPAINIGDRQKGRIKAKNVIDCKPEKSEIMDAINEALSQTFNNSIKDIQNPYGDGEVSDKMLTIIKCFLNKDVSLKKSFYDMNDSTT